MKCDVTLHEGMDQGLNGHSGVCIGVQSYPYTEEPVLNVHFIWDGSQPGPAPDVYILDLEPHPKIYRVNQPNIIAQLDV